MRRRRRYRVNPFIQVPYTSPTVASEPAGAPVYGLQPENIFKFDRVETYLDRAVNGYAYSHYGSRTTGRYDFTWTNTFEDAVDLARKGWPEGTKKIRQFQGSLSETIAVQHANKGTWRKVCTGGAVRVPSYIQGRPDCFLQYKQVRETKFVTVVYTGGASSNVPAEILMHKGAMVAAAVDLLEARSIRVKLVLAYANNHVTELYVTLKEHNESLDLDRIAFWLAHPAAFRRIRFGFYDTVENATVRHAGDGMGMSENPTYQGDIFIPRAFSRHIEPQWSTIESSIEHIRGLLKAKGIEL